MTVTCIISCAGYPKNIAVLQRCIQSIVQAKKKGIKAIIVVTTNNPQHCIPKNLHINFLFVSTKDSGFVQINNIAVQKTIQLDSDFYLIINDDAEIKNDFFYELKKTAFLDKQRGDVYIPYIYEGHSKKLDSFGVEYFRTGYSKNSFSPKIITSLASMSCLLIRTRFLKKMVSTYGFFLNPVLCWYLDDVEFSIRALAIGGIFSKCNNLIAYHLRTFTWGRKSYFVMYQSFRNLLWVIVLTWPRQFILKNALRISYWQTITAAYCFIKYSPWMYLKILLDTVQNWHTLQTGRKNILKQYTNARVFSTIFSSLEIRHDRITF